jgi:hypothetical protein
MRLNGNASTARRFAGFANHGPACSRKARDINFRVIAVLRCHPSESRLETTSPPSWLSLTCLFGPHYNSEEETHETQEFDVVATYCTGGSGDDGDRPSFDSHTAPGCLSGNASNATGKRWALGSPGNASNATGKRWALGSPGNASNATGKRWALGSPGNASNATGKRWALGSPGNASNATRKWWSSQRLEGSNLSGFVA